MLDTLNKFSNEVVEQALDMSIRFATVGDMPRSTSLWTVVAEDFQEAIELKLEAISKRLLEDDCDEKEQTTGYIIQNAIQDTRDYRNNVPNTYKYSENIHMFIEDHTYVLYSCCGKWRVGADLDGGARSDPAVLFAISKFIIKWEKEEQQKCLS